MFNKFFVGMIAAFLCGLFLCCDMVEAATLPMAAAQVLPFKPVIDIVGWVLVCVVTIFL